MRIELELFKRIESDMHVKKKREVIREWARKLSVSEKTLYRLFRTRTRQSTEEVDYETIKKIASAKLMTLDKKGKVLSTQDVIDELKRIGALPHDFKYHRSTIDRLLRKYHLDIPSLTREAPAVHLVSYFPNQVHEIDSTVAQTYYLDHFGRVVWDPFLKMRKGRRGNPQLKLILYSGWDHFSCCLYARYFLAPSENSADLFQFLYEFWQKKKDSALPFYGFPLQYIYTDQSGIFKSKSIKNLFEKLSKIVGFEHKMHEPGNPRATGGVESSMKTLARFEKKLNFRIRQGEHPTLEELNQWLYEFLVDLNNDPRYGRNGQSRCQIWINNVQQKMLKTPPPFIDFVKLAYHQGETRQINKHGEITWKAQVYYLCGLEDLMGQEVLIWHGLSESAIYIETFTGEIYGPFYPGRNEVPFGSYHRPHLTRYEQNRRELKRIAGELLGVTEDYGFVDPAYVRKDNIVHPVPSLESISPDGPVASAAIPIQQEFTPDEAMLYIAIQVNIYWENVPPELTDFIRSHLESLYLKNGKILREEIDAICEKLTPVLQEHGLI